MRADAMRVKLSSFLQWQLNILIIQKLGWQISFYYLLILGKLFYFLNGGERRRIVESIEAVYGDQRNGAELENINKTVFRGIFAHYYEKLFNAYTDACILESFFAESIEARCLEKLDDALENGRGVLFVTGHYGGIEYIPIFLASRGYPISVVAKFATQQLKQACEARSESFGLKIIDGSRRNDILPNILQELRINRIVFLECDEIEEWRPSRKEKMVFLRKMIGVDRTISLIARRSKAALIFGILHRFNLQKYRLVIQDCDDILSPQGEPATSVGKAVLRCLEQFIYSYPEEWYQWKKYEDLESHRVPAPEDGRIRPALRWSPCPVKIAV
jgi:lauroyl/myristoyl acyltransferase